MDTYSHHSARAVCKQSEIGVSTVDFYGFLTEKGLNSLRLQVGAFISNARVVVTRFDTAVSNPFASTVGGVHFSESCSSKPIALVVRPEHYDEAMAFARLMARRGIRRVVFLPTQLELAHQWAAHVCQSQREKLLQAQP